MAVTDVQITKQLAPIAPSPAVDARPQHREDHSPPRPPATAGVPPALDLTSDQRSGHLRYRVAIYAVLDPRNGHIRISRTNQLQTRYREIAALAPPPLEVIGCIESWPRLARGIHKALSADRLEDDWFAPTPAVKAVVTLICAGRTDALEQRYLDR
jgi:hypothetical protein